MAGSCLLPLRLWVSIRLRTTDKVTAVWQRQTEGVSAGKFFLLAILLWFLSPEQQISLWVLNQNTSRPLLLLWILFLIWFLKRKKKKKSERNVTSHHPFQDKKFTRWLYNFHVLRWTPVAICMCTQLVRSTTSLIKSQSTIAAENCRKPSSSLPGMTNSQREQSLFQ